VGAIRSLNMGYTTTDAELNQIVTCFAVRSNATRPRLGFRIGACGGIPC